ncbi:ribosome maturation factor RimM [bacterium]|nr:ribosome maturation factor RimM [bacterium]
MSEDTEGIRQIAAIINTHGIKGELKVMPLTDDPEIFLRLEELIVLKDNRKERHSLTGAREAKNHWLLKFDQITDISQAAELKGCALYTEESNLRPLDEEEFFIDDLINSKVYSTDDQYLGKITKYFEAGPQVVCEVDTEDGTFLFPTSAEVLKEIIPPDKVIINLIPGLMDLNTQSNKK